MAEKQKKIYFDSGNSGISVPECPVCLEHMSGPIRLCKAGHSVCNNCTNALQDWLCPLCREQMTEMRNYQLEELILELKVHCPNKPCVHTVKRVEMDQHLKECIFRIMECPLEVANEKCTWNGLLKDMLTHVEERHPSSKIKLNENMELKNIKTDEDKRLVFLANMGKYLFIVTFRIDMLLKLSYFVIQHIGSRPNANKYLYDIEVTSSADGRRLLSFKDRCFSDAVKVDEVFQLGCCHFLRLPHKDGPKYKVGNPLAKDFLDMFSQNVLSSQGFEAEKVLNFGRMMSYWRNNRERVIGQQVVWLPDQLLPPISGRSNRRYGAILPQVVVAGTLTRRASEPTWMTASNAQESRIGSELRAMVQAPPGYKFVGADVDSQELWISALLGDSSLGICGGTAFGWSVLAGSRASQTDLHTLTAKAAGVSRDHAKVINYARIYGAGQNFAERLLKQFNPTMTNAEAKSKANKMYTSTKGRRVYKLKRQYMEGLMPDEDFTNECVEMTSYQAMRLAKMSGRTVGEMFERPQWVGGTESQMFNKLEEIADSPSPATAFLNGRLSRALEGVEQWTGTRHNWCVQSAAADFLHLMMCSMAHLRPETRFSLSFHDEVRYLVPEELKYEAALSLQITNLLTRAFCSQRVGINDLPQSVAFFTSVEVDQVLRKESNLSCITPSNPHGLENGYGIPNGESLSIFDCLEKVKKS